MIEADRLSEMLRITKGELASVTGLSRDCRVEDRPAEGAGDAVPPAGRGRDHQSGAPMGGLRASGVRLVPVATDSPRSANRPPKPWSRKAGRRSQTLPRSDRRRRICVRLTGLVYRAHNPRWSFAPMSGRGAALYGGRFNPVGMEALYTSLQVEAAWREAQRIRLQGAAVDDMRYRVDCEDIADLRARRSSTHWRSIQTLWPARGRIWSSAG